MTALENRAGIYITSTKIQFVEFAFRNQEYILEHLDEAYFDEELQFGTDKETKLLSKVQAAFNEIAAKYKINAKSVYIALPPECFHIVRVPYDNTLLRQDLLTQFTWEFSQLFPQESPDDYTIQFYEIEDPHFTERNYSIITALHRRFLRVAKSFAQKNSFVLNAVQYSHFASDSALLLNYPAVNEGIYISLLLENAVLSFELLIGGKPVYVRTRKLKNEGELGQTLRGELAALADFNIDREQINSAFLFADRLSPAFVTSIEEFTGLKIFPVNPFKRFTIHAKLSTSKILKEHFYSFAPAAGACYRLS